MFAGDTVMPSLFVRRRREFEHSLSRPYNATNS